MPYANKDNKGETNIIVLMATIMPAAAVHHLKYLKLGRKFGAALTFRTAQARLRTLNVNRAANVTMEAMISTLGAVDTSNIKTTVRIMALEGVSSLAAPFLNGCKNGNKLSLVASCQLHCLNEDLHILKF